MFRWMSIGVMVLSWTVISAQSPYFPTGHYAERAVLKFEARLGADFNDLHSAIRPVSRKDVHLLYRDESPVGASPLWRDLRLENNEWIQYPNPTDSTYKPQPASDHPILNWFYRSPAHFLEVYRNDFYLQIDPMIHFQGGRLDDHRGLTRNKRGLRLVGGIDGKIGLYADIVESQVRYAPYINARIRRFDAIPGEGLFKEYNSDVFDVRGGYDFLNSRAHIAFPLTKHISTQFGYGRHFFGFGKRSLLLSDHANNYTYLAINTRVWKLHYKNIFGQLHAVSPENTAPNALLPKKYIAAHYLSFKGIENLEIGLYEAVVFSRENGFEWTYLIPVILYRTVEQGLGSPDNVILGFNFGYRPIDRLRLYSQVVLDEFVFDEWFGDNRDWWGNKAGWQLGIQYYDLLGASNWDGQIEWNTVRPYTYTHRDSSSNYVHYNQPLAHPLGANFSEFIISLDGRIDASWSMSTYLIRQRYGDDPPGQNFGSNLLKSSDTRVGDYDQTMFQGIDTERWIVGGMLYYRLFPGGVL